MITLTKIAKMANVSVSTASKAFSMSPEVSEETRNIIFEIAKSHGVLKKFYSAKYPKLVIGVICSNYYNPFFPDILKKLQEKLEEYGCDMCVASSNASSAKESELYEYYSLYSDVDAIITLGRTISPGDDYPLPRVDISPWYIDEKTPTLVYNFESIENVIKYFHSKGVRSVGFISCYKKSGKCYKFKKFMNSVYGGFDEALIEVAEFEGGKCGYEAVLSMIRKGNVPRAVFCERDDVAFGAIKALCDNGYRVPQDVAVVGWDNYSYGEYSMPTLSTIHISTEEIISKSVDMIIKKLSGKECENYVEIMSSFIERESSRID